MRYEFTFPYRDNKYLASVLFSFEEEPYFLSTTLLDTNLVNEFGQSLSIKTDGDDVLHNPKDSVDVIQL
ncbi:MAG TPA: hypothetical protein VD794_09810, partial [Flavisolibacter sp.]|nr:hypothetical protein [Flavisolibacter sp.]